MIGAALGLRGAMRLALATERTIGSNKK